jgi:prepilin-type N-terminal cleavage/methylation domain-containing protein
MRAAPKSRAERCRGESGVSLIELIIAMALSSMLLVPLGAGFYFGLRSSADTQSRLTQSNRATLLSSYFSADVQGANAAATGTAEATSVCGTAVVTADLLLSRPDGSSVSYSRGIGAAATDWMRRTCAGGAVTSSVRVIRNLAGAPTIACPLTPSCAVTLTQTDPAGHSSYTTNLQASRRGT